MYRYLVIELFHHMPLSYVTSTRTIKHLQAAGLSCKVHV